MSLSRSLRALTIIAAGAATIAEVVIGLRAQLPVWLIDPLAVATGGIVIVSMLALDALARRASRPDRRDIFEVRDLQHRNAAQLDTHDQRLLLAEARIRFLIARHDLVRAERDLAHYAECVERWDSLADDLPHWNAAMQTWSAIIAGVHADLGPDMGAANEAELQSARAQLPPAHNFSSKDLKATIAYLVQRQRVVDANERFNVYGAQILAPIDPPDQN